MKKIILSALAAVFAASLSAEEFSVGAVNCGNFGYGRKGVTEGEYSGGWEQLATDNKVDVFFYGDVGTNIFPVGSKGVDKLDIRVVIKDGKGELSVVELPRSIEVEGKVRKTPRYRALRVVREYMGKKIAFYGVHLVAEGHIKAPKPQKGQMTYAQKLRQMQFKALIDDASSFEYAVFTGDFNSQKPYEYETFTQAGYVIANCSKEFGVIPTLRDTLPVDNIIVSPGLGIVHFDVPQCYKINTDHYPVLARLNTKDEAIAQINAAPTLEEYLKLPRERRVELFADGVFRKKMYEHGYAVGEGLLSRWVAVDKIPNLRDVGGIATKDGRILKRKLMYRSAGWNDNAKTSAELPEAKWKKGKNRLTRKGRKHLAELGIKTDLDLRTERECWGMEGSPLGKDVKWIRRSFGSYARFKKFPWARNAVKEAFDVLSDEASYPLVFHCIGGADRTGCLAMMVQILCGVDEDEALKDWELTGCYTARLSFAHAKSISLFLSHLAEFPGDTEEMRMRNFLASCGVSNEQMEKVRQIMIESPVAKE